MCLLLLDKQYTKKSSNDRGKETMIG